MKKFVSFARRHAWRLAGSALLAGLGLWWGLAGLGIIPAAAAVLLWCR